MKKKFREDVEANMQRELNNAIRTKVKNRIMDQLYTLNKVDVPEALVANEIVQLKKTNDSTVWWRSRI
ncbi:MAG: hypothetical protein ACJ0Q0_01545 [Porticoccaceae bacterium]